MQAYNSSIGSNAAMRNTQTIHEQNTISLGRLYEINDTNKKIKQLMFYTSLFFISYRKYYPENNYSFMYPLVISFCTLNMGSSFYLESAISKVATFRLLQLSNQEIRIEFEKIAWKHHYI